jgi:hypothetical protein
VYFIILKWNIELLQIFIFELVQYTFYSMQIQGYIARLFPLKLIGKYLLLYNKFWYYNITTCEWNVYMVLVWPLVDIKWQKGPKLPATTKTMYKHDHEQTVKFHSHDLCYNKMQMNSVYLFFMLYRKKRF